MRRRCSGIGAEHTPEAWSLAPESSSPLEPTENNRINTTRVEAITTPKIHPIHPLVDVPGFSGFAIILILADARCAGARCQHMAPSHTSTMAPTTRLPRILLCQNRKSQLHDEFDL